MSANSVSHTGQDARGAVRPAAAEVLNVSRLSLLLHGAVILVLAFHFASYLRYALAAVEFPFEVDYGEGIVWQQALLMPGERMYGDITRFPFIVFHYPPLYYLVVRAVATMGADMLAAGRAISVLCTLLIGVLAGALSYDAAAGNSRRTAGIIGSVVAGLTVFCYWPVVCWSPMFRVDMLAIMLCFLGVWLAGRASRHPWLIYPAVLSFVLAVYTKQTSISAPLAVMLVGLAADRGRTLRAFGLGLGLGLSALAVLLWLTDGGFIRHILMYNLNRFSLRAAAAALLEEWPQTPFLVLALGGLAAGWKIAMGTQPTSLAALRQAIGRNASGPLMAILTLYLIFATLMLSTLGKSGGKLNYMLEWMCLWSVFIGILVTSLLSGLIAAPGQGAIRGGRRAALALLVPIVLLSQIVIMPTQRDYFGGDTERTRQLGRLVERIKDARRPVLSDDMVLLMRAGKEVPWEPSIFAELASTGRWDESLIVNMIDARKFAFIITRGKAGEELYDSRFTPAVDRAIREAYPRTEVQGGRTLHLPPA